MTFHADYFRDKLPERLLRDFFDFRMFSEADMEACAYMWTRRDYADATHNLSLHRQHRIANKSGSRWWVPDMVLVNINTDRVVAIVELKFVVGLANPERLLDRDFEKAKAYRRRFPFLHRFIQIYMYGPLEDGAELAKYSREPWMRDYYIEVPINVERPPGGRLRRPGGGFSFSEFMEEWRTVRDRMAKKLHE